MTGSRRVFQSAIGKDTNKSNGRAGWKVQGQGECDQISFFASGADRPWSHLGVLNHTQGDVEASSVLCSGGGGEVLLWRSTCQRKVGSPLASSALGQGLGCVVSLTGVLSKLLTWA